MKQIKVKSEILIFKDTGDTVFMINKTIKSGGVVNKIYADLSDRIDIKPT